MREFVDGVSVDLEVFLVAREVWVWSAEVFGWGWGEEDDLPRFTSGVDHFDEGAVTGDEFIKAFGALVGGYRSVA